MLIVVHVWDVYKRQGKAKEMIYTCAMIKADEALRIGLVNKVVPLENLMEEARKMASVICANAPIAVKYCKDAINRGMQVDIDKACLLYTSRCV